MKNSKVKVMIGKVGIQWTVEVNGVVDFIGDRRNALRCAVLWLMHR